ncbi:MAG: helix-turn-helix transcriptional regulator [Bacteroidetes bacterium]|nr:helix-turn-helix transcriptional regulator [Bacteroidota bacterium]
MDDIKDRIVHLMKTKNINATQLAETLGIQRSGISHILSGRNKPGTEFIIRIKESFPEFSLDWLLLGKGPATLSPEVAAGANPSQPKLPRVQGTLFDFSEPEQQKAPDPPKNVSSQPEVQAASQPAPQAAHEVKAGDVLNEPAKKENPPRQEGDEPKVVKLILVYSDHTFRVLEPKA